MERPVACRNARVIVLLIALSLACNDKPALAPAAPTPSAPAPSPAPTRWAVSGHVLEAPGGAPIGGATLTFGDGAPVVADASGNFSVVTTDTSTKSLTIAAPGYWTRETSMTGGAARAGVLFDLIGTEPGFPRAQYLDLARNAYESPSRHEPTRRWTANPNVYISTKWRDSAQSVRPESIDFLISEIKRIIPLWTAGTLLAGTIETGFGARPRANGWITIEFGVSGNWSLLGADPGQVQFGSEGPCQSFAIVHELGHALGYWHSSVKPSMMGGGPATCRLYDLTPNEALIARVMYSREPGNLEPDKDGPPPPPAVYTARVAAAAGGAPAGALQCDALFQR